MELDKLTPDQEAWLTALESGNYEQVDGDLYCHGCYCCLGVAAAVMDPEHQGLRDNGWDKREFEEDEFDRHISEYKDDGATLPPDLVDRLQLTDSAGHFRLGVKRYGENCLTKINDGGATFCEIAALIRNEPWLVFTNFTPKSKGAA